MRYSGNQVPPSMVRQINKEKKETQDIGRDILSAVGEAQDVIGKLAACIREAGKSYHGEELEMKISELRRRTANITVSLGQMKIISGSIAKGGKDH